MPVDDRVFLYGPNPANRVEFDLDPTGAVRGLRWVAPDGPEPYIRVERATLTPERRAAYAGRYVAPEAEDAVITIAVAGEDLVAHEGPDHAGKMVAADADVFTLADTGTFVFDRAKSGAITGFRLFSGRLRGLQFEREKESKR